MTKQELAEKVKVTRQTLNNWEKEKPELIKLIKLGLEKENQENNNQKKGENNNGIIIKNNNNNGNININTSSFNNAKDIEEVIELLKYAPSGFIVEIKKRLKQFKEMSKF